MFELNRRAYCLSKTGCISYYSIEKIITRDGENKLKISPTYLSTVTNKKINTVTFIKYTGVYKNILSQCIILVNEKLRHERFYCLKYL